MSASDTAVAKYEDEPQADHMGGQHTFESNVISGNGQAHFGDLHQYSYTSYSVSDARDTVYHNTLAATLRSLVLHPSMKGSARYIPLFSIFFNIAAGQVLPRIEVLQTSIQRLQSIEQAFIANRRQSQDVDLSLLQPECDRKVQKLRIAAAKLLQSVQNISENYCTGRGSEVCADEFCDLVERLSTQINAREDIRNIICKLQHPIGPSQHTRFKQELDLTHEDDSFSAYTNNDTPELCETPAQPLVLDQQEYLYANQDFWRQLNIVLSSITWLRRQAWLRLAKTIVIAALIFYAVFFVMRWFMFIMTPEPFKHDFDPTPYIFAIIATLFYLVATFSIGKAWTQLGTRTGPISLGERGDVLV